MRTVGYIDTFLGGAITDAVVRLLMAPQEGKRTHSKISDTVDGFCKKRGIKLSKEGVDNLVDDIKEAVSDIVE